MSLRLLTLFLLVFHCFESTGQPIPEIIPADSSMVVYDRNIQEAKLDSFKKNPAYNYRLDPEYETNLLKKLWLLILNKLDDAFSREVSGFIGKMIYYGLIIGAISGLIWFLLKRSGSGIFHRRNERRAIGIEEINEANTLIEIESHLSQSIMNSDYRLATRLYFLRCLRLLDDHDIIEWKSGKTNLEYVKEMKSKNLKSHFEDLSYIYDYVWYGEFEVEHEEAFNRIQERFKSFDHLIKNRG